MYVVVQNGFIFSRLPVWLIVGVSFEGEGDGRRLYLS